MATTDRFTVIRDPVWNNIQLDDIALTILNTEPFQRLRYVRQLGHAFLVYPGATHTRFEHALGTYHLACRALSILAERRELSGVDDDEPQIIKLAALLHDIGHYPFSHALEEAGLPSHEQIARRQFRHRELRGALEQIGLPDIDKRLSSLITGTGTSALAGLISGSLDLDKIEYLTRDARMCEVPYGTVDVDRLLHALTVVRSDDGSVTVGIREKGLSALESLLFARYQMYRNVYWHHAVRSATAMFKRLVRTAVAGGLVEDGWIADATDEALMEKLRGLTDHPLAARLRYRRLYKRLLEHPSHEVPGPADAVSENPELLERVENQLARDVGLAPGEVLLDFPRKSTMLEVDMPLLRKGGTVEWLTPESAHEVLSIQGIADQLHANARMFRVFAAKHKTMALTHVLDVIETHK